MAQRKNETTRELLDIKRFHAVDPLVGQDNTDDFILDALAFICGQREKPADKIKVINFVRLRNMH